MGFEILAIITALAAIGFVVCWIIAVRKHPPVNKYTGRPMVKNDPNIYDWSLEDDR